MELKLLNFKRIKLSETSTKRLQMFKGRTGLTPNIACRIALGLSLSQNKIPSTELYSEESANGQEINRYTLLGEHEQLLIALFTQWCYENDIKKKDYNLYFRTHINRGVELLFSRVKGIQDLTNILN